MTSAQEKVVQFLNEAHATERGMVRALQAQIAIAPRGRHREGLESHLKQTLGHAERTDGRLRELGYGPDMFASSIGLVQSVVAQTLAAAKTPLQLVRGSRGTEKVLKNAKDACASEALEVATYTALEDLASSVGDTKTARLAASIRGDEQDMLERLIGELPTLTDAVVAAEVRGNSSYEIGQIGVADAARAKGRDVRSTVRRAGSAARRTAREARKVPGVARAEGEVKGAIASERDLPISRYEELTASEIADKLPGLSQIDIAKIDAYERRHQGRTTILSRIASLRREEPWPGYDELDVGEVRSVLSESDKSRARVVASYERAHKNRTGVLDAAEHELSTA